jgi:lysophospholipase L1-like esterase
VLAWHAGSGAAVPDIVARDTGRRVESRAKPGARVSASSPGRAEEGFDIRAQYTPGPWDWVMVNGGANDLMAECGCRRCAATLADMIAPDGQGGEIADLVDRITAAGARVLLLGYYAPNARANPFTRCADETRVLNARLAGLARTREAVHYVSAAKVIDPADPRHWFLDHIHPSRLGAERIGALMAGTINRIDPAS